MRDFDPDQLRAIRSAYPGVFNGKGHCIDHPAWTLIVNELDEHWFNKGGDADEPIRPFPADLAHVFETLTADHGIDVVGLPSRIRPALPHEWCYMTNKPLDCRPTNDSAIALVVRLPDGTLIRTWATQYLAGTDTEVGRFNLGVFDVGTDKTDYPKGTFN